MFDIRLRTHLSSAGFHLAHIQNTNNRNTDWQHWGRAELTRRMTFNIHPWNWCLLAKADWGRQGGRPEILSWIQTAYIERYGESYLNWLQRLDLPRPHETSDPQYEFAEPEHEEGISPPSRAAHAHTERNRSATRPVVRRAWEGQGVILEIIAPYGRFIVPHDDLLNWVFVHKEVEATVSWQRDGVYSWPKAPADMLVFLRQYEQ